MTDARDIVERLRAKAGTYATRMECAASLECEAADIIEQRREQANALALQADEWEGKYQIVSDMNASLRKQLEDAREALDQLIWSPYYGIKDDMMSNGCEHGFKPSASCPNTNCEKGAMERRIDEALKGKS